MSVFRNLLNAWFRHKTSFLLNILGLSVAFFTFYILMSQVLFEWGFDSFHKGADRIYRMEFMQSDGRYHPSSTFPRLYHIINSLPYIESGGIKTIVRDGYIVQPGDTTGSNSVNTSFCYVTMGYADVFTFDMIEGATDSLGNPGCAIIPLSLAEKLYGKRKSYLNEEFGDNQSWALRVGGVYRDFPKNSMIQNIVYQIPNEEWFDRYMSDWKNGGYSGYLKLKENVDPESFVQHLNVKIGDAEEVLNNLRLCPLNDIYYSSLPSNDISIVGNRSINRLFFSIAVLIVFIAGVNFMNFSMALVPSKIKSINTRLVLGASALHLRIFLVFEAVFSALLAFLLSLLAVYLVSRTSFASYLDADMRLSAQLVLVGISLCVAFTTGFFSGIYPSYYITSFPPARVVNGSFALSPKGRMLRNGLIGLQFTISLVVVVVVLFMSLQNRFMQNESPGFDKGQIAYLDLTSEIRLHKSDALINKLKENPFVEDIAFIEQPIGTSDKFMGWGRQISNGDFISFQVLPVTPAYLKVLGIQVTEGRDFRPEDENSQFGVFIFNQAAKKKFNLELGDVIKGQGTIVGFIPDIKFQSFRNTVNPMAFYVWGTENWGMRSFSATIRLKTGSNMYKTARYIEQVAKELDPEFNTDGKVRFYDQVLQNLYERERKQYLLVSIFSIFIIFISIVGVFGLVVFETQTRRKEVGIRKVFGSTEWQILYLFNKTYIRIVLICAVVAIPVAYRIVGVWLQNFAYRVSLHVWVSVVALFIVMSVVVLTVTIQSWRASKADPVRSIKNE